MDSSTMTEGVPLSRLESLPTELRLQIFRYLLASKHVRSIVSDRKRFSADHLSPVAKFSFCTSLLTVNKCISRDALKILHQENGLIKVNLQMDSLNSVIQTFDNHEVPHFLHKSIEAFKNFTARIQIQSKMYPKSDTTTFLLLLDDMPAFCRYLRVMDLCNCPAFDFEFRIKDRLPIATQKRILEPFTCLNGCASVQSVSITGRIDSAVSKPVLTAMTQTVGWELALLWEFYDCMAQMLEIGDAAFLSGNMDGASYKYAQAVGFYEMALDKFEPYRPGFDKDYDEARWRSDVVSAMNCSLADLIREKYHEVAPEVYDSEELPYLMTMEHLGESYHAQYEYLIGIGALGRDNFKEAVKHLAFAVKLATGNDREHFEHCLLTARAWPTSTLSERKNDLADLILKLPRIPYTLPPPKKYGRFQNESEKYVCHQLGYKGSFPKSVTDLVHSQFGVILITDPRTGSRRTAQVGEVHPEALKKSINRYKKTIVEEGKIFAKRKLGIPKMWVALSVGSLGQKSVMDTAEGRAFVGHFGRVFAQNMRAAGIDLPFRSI